MKFKAAVLEKTKRPLKIIKFSKKEPGYRQVLVKVLYSSVCGSQIFEKDGMRGKDKWLPHFLGHEGVGSVVSTGRNSKKFKVGEKVIITWIGNNGIGSKQKIFYKKKSKIYNAGPCTTFSELTIVDENKLIKLPKKILLKHASLFGCAFPTGMGMVKNVLKPLKNKLFILVGLGGVGISSLFAIKSYKPKKIIVIDCDKKKKKLAISIGADFFLSPYEKNLNDIIFKHTAGKMGDYCIESSGNIISLQNSLKFINSKGTLVFASHPKNNDKVKINPHELIKGKKIFGSWGGNTNFKRDLNFYVSIYLKHLRYIKKFFNKTYKLNKINSAFSDLKKHKTLRPIIKF